MAEFFDKRAYFRDVVDPIPGWLVEEAAIRTLELLEYQHLKRIKGSLLEIGVYGGKYFSVLMWSARETGHRIVGLDTFQWKKRGEVEAGLGALAAGMDPKPVLIERRSTDLQAEQLLAVLGDYARFISVDGSHQMADVFWDLRLAEVMLAPGGIVALDDFLNPQAIGVNEAAHRFFGTPRNLVPFALITNKLFLCRKAMHDDYKTLLEMNLRAAPETDAAKRFVAEREKGRDYVEGQLWGDPFLIVT